MGYKTEIHRHREQYGGYLRGKGIWGGTIKGKGDKYMGDDLTLGGGHRIKYTDHVS